MCHLRLREWLERRQAPPQLRATRRSCSCRLSAQGGDLSPGMRNHALPFLPRNEGGLEAVERDRGKLVEREVEVGCGEEVLVGKRRIAHQPVVGVEHDLHAAIEVASQWMLLVRE